MYNKMSSWQVISGEYKNRKSSVITDPTFPIQFNQIMKISLMATKIISQLNNIF